MDVGFVPASQKTRRFILCLVIFGVERKEISKDRSFFTPGDKANVVIFCVP